MNYYLNEYSLRGQFKDVDSFFISLRDETLPALKVIEERNEGIIWKKDAFWQCYICDGINFYNIPKRRNERNAETTALKIKLQKLVNEDPFWDGQEETTVRIREYGFDSEYRDYFDSPNCFEKALENEGRIFSFVHPEYRTYKLPIFIQADEENVESYCLDNIYDVSWWDTQNEKGVEHWYINDKYYVEVRANESSYHPPHFHVSYKDYAAVFKLEDGAFYKEGKNKMSMQMRKEIQQWYQLHKAELQEAWIRLHG